MAVNRTTGVQGFALANPNRSEVDSTASRTLTKNLFCRCYINDYIENSLKSVSFARKFTSRYVLTYFSPLECRPRAQERLNLNGSRCFP